MARWFGAIMAVLALHSSAQAHVHLAADFDVRPYLSDPSRDERPYRRPYIDGERAMPPPPPPPSVTPAPAPKTPPYNPREREAVVPIPPAPAPPAPPPKPTPAAPPPVTLAAAELAPTVPPAAGIFALALIVLSLAGLVVIILRWDELQEGVRKVGSPTPNLRKLREKEAKLYAAAANRAFKAAEEEPQGAEQHLKKASEFAERARKAQGEIHIVDELAAIEEAEARERLNDLRHQQELARERREIERVEASAGKSKAATSAFQAAYEAKVAKKLHAEECGIKLPEDERSTPADLMAIIEKMQTESIADGDINGAHELGAFLRRFKKDGPREQA